MTNQNFSLIKRAKSFVYAFNGLKALFKNEHNFRIHLVVAVVTIILGLLLHLTAFEWIALIFAIGFILVSESINSAIEILADFVSPEKNSIIKKIKDISAASVLLSALTALSVGIIVFIPKLFSHV